MRKVCVVVGSRANYSSIKSAMCAITRHPDLELQTVVAASALLERYGHVGQLVEQDGFTPAARVYMLIEGETPATMAKSTGLGLVELPTVFEQLRPDLVLTVGDRFETMATALAAVKAIAAQYPGTTVMDRTTWVIKMKKYTARRGPVPVNVVSPWTKW